MTKHITHTDTEVLGVALEERVFLGLASLGGEGGSRGLLAGSGFGGFGLVIETRKQSANHSHGEERCSSEL